MAEQKTLAIKIDVSGNGKIEQLQKSFDGTQRALKRLNKEERDGLITSKQASSARAKLTTQHHANRNALNDERAAILKNNDALRKNSGFVNGVKKGMMQWSTTLIGATALIAGVTKLVGSAVKIFRDFEKANSQLEAVLGANAEQMKQLSTQAKELGSSTAFTASEVVSLQTELAKLGFPTEDILNMTEATLNGAAALGSELGEQAALTGALLKQYGLDASEATKVNDIMATAAANSALDFSKLSTALPIVGATAAAVGQDLTQTTALLGKLSDRGLDASTSGTSLRNVFLMLSKKGLTMNEAMEMINTSTDKAKTSMELFGIRGATTGLILADVEGKTTKLDIALQNTDGAAKKMADTMLNNLSGDITKAESAYEGFILSLEDGSGTISNMIRDVTQLGTSYLGMLTAINENTTAFEQLTAVGDIWSQQLGIMNEEQADIAKNLANNSDNIAVLDERLAAGTITQEQYNTALQKLANGWKRASKDISEAKEEIDGLGETTESQTELTDSEVSAINAKAAKRVKAKKDAENKALRDLEAQEASEVENEEGSLDSLVIENENILAINQEFYDAEKAQREEATNAEIEEERRKANAIAEFEQLKRDARDATVNAIGDSLSALSTLAKENSVEQKALATSAALIQTYLAISKTLAAYAGVPIPGFAIAQSIAIGINGFANVKRINSVKAERGMLLDGASHANGGIPFTVNGQSGYEAEGGEAIINKRSTAMFAPLLSEINQAGGGVAFKYGGLTKKFADGGSLPASRGVTSSQQSLNALGIDMTEFADSIVSGINDKEVINVASNTSDVANEVSNIVNEASF